MRGYILITIVAVSFLHRSTAFLEVNGPSEPILEGQDVTLECVDTESELNISTVHFERYSKYMKRWHRLESDQVYFYRRCFMYDVDVRREEGRLLLFIARIQSWSEGPYRCVSENSSAADNSSQAFTIPIHYMREVSVHRAGLGYLTRYLNSVQDLKVRLGDNVELECSTTASEAPEYFWTKEGEAWLLPSNKLKLENVREQDGGRFTCSAQSPTVHSLMKKRTVSITVLPEDAAWYETSTGFILMVSVAVFILLVVVISMTAYLCRRTKQSKGPIDDRSQKKPIYRASVESLPSIVSDKQPLV
ncbi:vascular endothelial growth factor receptor 3-like [Carassius auratus]|uniref:Vascular endothelial growth factor receptor 3-like n=1 Tax=Carassius auratus TaxID=7957 RepID=A0A6P6LKF5_CARAU|nr:vascular endothelial growth factor receptor 3-like [Carassius auratus]